MQCLGGCNASYTISSMLCNTKMATVPYGTRVSDSLSRVMTAYCAEELDVTILVLCRGGCASEPPVRAKAVSVAGELRLQPTVIKQSQKMAIQDGHPAIVMATCGDSERGEALMCRNGQVVKLRGAKELVGCASDLLMREYAKKKCEW